MDGRLDLTHQNLTRRVIFIVNLGFLIGRLQWRLGAMQASMLASRFVFTKKITTDPSSPKVGPVLGALLYKAAGFCLPFALTGTAILLSGGLVLLVTKMPNMASTTSSTETSSFALGLLTRPPVLISLATATAGAYSIGTVEVAPSFCDHNHLYAGNLVSLPLVQPGLANHKDRGGFPRDVSRLRSCYAYLWMALWLQGCQFGLQHIPLAALYGFVFVCFFCKMKNVITFFVITFKTSSDQVSPWIVSVGGCFVMFASFAFLGPAPYLNTILDPR